MTLETLSLIEEMKNNIENVIKDSKKFRQMKLDLGGHGITAGRVEQVLSNVHLLEDSKTDVRELILFAQEFYFITLDEKLNPRNYWTEYEIKEAKQYYPLRTEKEYDLPYVLENVSKVGHNVWSTVIDVKTIAKWMNSMVLAYNFDIQRESKISVRKGIVIERPTVYQKNVDEIHDLMNKGELVVTTIALNAAVGTSDEGDELIYDSKKNTLTINTGTRLDILDGFHRCLASLKTYTKNKDIDFKFNLLISNYTTPEARQYQAQLAKATPIPQSRADELGSNSMANTVIQQLRTNSELRGRVSSSESPVREAGEVTSHKILLSAIDKEFKMETRADAYEVSESLGIFFDMLIGKNKEEFLNKSRKTLMGEPEMFVGYISLAAKMIEKGISPTKVNDVIKDVDFLKENGLWRELDFLTKGLKVSVNFNEEKLSEYFRGLVQ